MIVAIDGIDGTGKRTQCSLLASSLERHNKKVNVVSFPVYGSFFGKMVSEYLNGTYGSLYSIDPKLTAMLYAMDRKLFFANSKNMDNDVLIIDRYVLSNLAHQGAKLDVLKRSNFIEWLKELEYNINGIPHPDISIVLDMEIQNSVDNVSKKKKRVYTNLKFDLHENNVEYLNITRKYFIELAEQENAHIIKCDECGKLKPESVILAEILCFLN